MPPLGMPKVKPLGPELSIPVSMTMMVSMSNGNSNIGGKEGRAKNLYGQTAGRNEQPYSNIGNRGAVVDAQIPPAGTVSIGQPTGAGKGDIQHRGSTLHRQVETGITLEYGLVHHSPSGDWRCKQMWCSGRSTSLVLSLQQLC